VAGAGEDWRVEVLGTGGVPMRSQVRVHRARQAAARLTCRAEADATAYVWTATLDGPD
jgi:hypothetical protein